MKLWFERGAWASKRGREIACEMRPCDVKKIVVVRHAALGDMVLVRPFLVEARRFFPNAEIILSVVSNYTYGAPEDLVDHIHVLHGNDQSNVSLWTRLKRAKELGDSDILFDLADTTRSRYLCLLSRAKLKIGFPYRWYLRNLLFDLAVFRSDFIFEADVMLDALRLLGANPSIPLDFGWGAQESSIGGGFNGHQVILYFPFASISRKCWPAQRFEELILKLSDELPNYSHVILGGLSRQESPECFVGLQQLRPNIRIQGAVSLTETVSLLRHARLLVSNDTGIRNMALSLGTSTIGIFFSTLPFRYCPQQPEKHRAIFNFDGEIPSVSQVASASIELLVSGEKRFQG